MADILPYRTVSSYFEASCRLATARQAGAPRSGAEGTGASRPPGMNDVRLCQEHVAMHRLIDLAADYVPNEYAAYWWRLV
jgi:hypothetical protein